MQKPDYMLTMSDLQRSNDKLRANIVALHLEKKQLKQEIAKAKRDTEKLMKLVASKANEMAKTKKKPASDDYTWTKEDFEKAKNDPMLKREIEEAFYSALFKGRDGGSNGQ